MMPLDLNLLTVFDTLYDQRSVTRAASRLGLTQSAVSHALRRLREAIDDPLFVRAGRVLRPTARADTMASDVRAGLAQLHQALAPAAFDPGSAERTFTLGAGSYFCRLVIPGLLAVARQVAPGVAIRVVPFADDLLAALDARLVDVAFGVFEQVPGRLVAQRLFAEELVWIAATASDLVGRRLVAADLVDRARLELGPPRPFGMPDAVTRIGGLAARSVADTIARRTAHEPGGQGTVYDALTAVGIVGTTDLVAIVPRRIAELERDRAKIVILDVAEPAPSIDIVMLWHRQTDADPGLVWLRSLVMDL